MKQIFEKFKKHKLGLLPLTEDKRDYLVENVLGWFGEYKTKQAELILPVPFYKSQYRNTCTFNSGTEGKECDEDVELAVRNAVKRGRALGLVSGDGFSSLRTVEVVKQKYGICEAKFCDENKRNDWEEYSKPVFTYEEEENAKLHKSSTFLKITSVDQLLKFLDEGRTVRIGISWKTNFNNSGLPDSYILDFTQGEVIGGHAILARGYKDFGNLIRFRNSYGQTYGLNGDAYIRKADLQREMNKFGAFVDWDMPKDVAKWLNDFAGKCVQEYGSSNVYKIENGKARLFPDMATVYAHGFTDEQIAQDEGNILSEVDRGEPMNFWDSPNIMLVKAMILRKEQLRPIFQKYFSELFI